jgi:hypothetical protein
LENRKVLPQFLFDSHPKIFKNQDLGNASGSRRRRRRRRSLIRIFEVLSAVTVIFPPSAIWRHVVW